jgi:hypothetical protein
VDAVTTFTPSASSPAGTANLTGAPAAALVRGAAVA